MVSALRRGVRVVSVIVWVFIVCQPTGAHELPDIGEPSLRGMSYADERRLGEVIVAQVRANLPIMNDIELSDYLDSLGSQLTAVRSAARLDFHFLLVRNSQINAFATPGGVIAINTGLVAEADNEMELAGVLAHEIAHIDRRHLPRMLALTENVGWLQTLVAIMSVMAATYDAALGRVGLGLSNALSIERRLSHTRAFEREADRFGLDLMAEAGFDPQGAVDFFRSLYQRQATETAPPEFLLTHPLTEERLATAQNLAQKYRGDYRQDSRQFRFFKARMAALLQPERYAFADARRARDDERLAEYRRAVALLAYGNPRVAGEILSKLFAKNSSDMPVGLAYMQALLATDRVAEAEAVGRTLQRFYPKHESVVYYRAKALVALKKPRQALNEMTALARHRKIRSVEIHRLMAESANVLGQAARARESFGDYYAGSGRLRAAISQYKLVLADADLSRTARARVEAKQKRLNALLERMRAAR